MAIELGAGSRSAKCYIDTMIEKLQGAKAELVRKEMFANIRKSNQLRHEETQLCLPHLDRVEQLLRIKACGLPAKDDVGPVVVAAMQLQQYRLVLEIEYCGRNASILLYSQEETSDTWQCLWRQKSWSENKIDDADANQKLAGVKQALGIDCDDPRLVIALLALSGAAISPMCLYSALLALDPSGGKWDMLGYRTVRGAEPSPSSDENTGEVDAASLMPQVTPEIEWWETLTISTAQYKHCPNCSCNCDLLGTCLGECSKRSSKRLRE